MPIGDEVRMSTRDRHYFILNAIAKIKRIYAPAISHYIATECFDSEQILIKLNYSVYPPKWEVVLQKHILSAYPLPEGQDTLLGVAFPLNVGRNDFVVHPVRQLALLDPTKRLTYKSNTGIPLCNISEFLI